MTIPILGLKYTIPLVCNTCGVEIKVTFKRGENPKSRRTECPNCGCAEFVNVAVIRAQMREQMMAQDWMNQMLEQRAADRLKPKPKTEPGQKPEGHQMKMFPPKEDGNGGKQP